MVGNLGLSELLLITLEIAVGIVLLRAAWRWVKGRMKT